MTEPLQLSPERQRSLTKLARKEERRVRAWRRSVYVIRALGVLCLPTMLVTLRSPLPSARPAAFGLLLLGLMLATLGFASNPQRVPPAETRVWHGARDLFGALWGLRPTIRVRAGYEAEDARRIVRRLFSKSRSPEAGALFADPSTIDLAVDAAVAVVLLQVRATASSRTSPLSVAGALDTTDPRTCLAKWDASVDRDVSAIVGALKLHNSDTLEHAFLTATKLLRGRLGTPYL